MCRKLVEGKSMKKIILILTILFINVSGFAQAFSVNSSKWNDSFVSSDTMLPDLKIYPNPCTDQKVTIQLNNDKLSEIRLTNITGKVVLIKNYQVPVSKQELMLGNFPDGIYLVQVRTSQNKIIVKKLVISGN